MGYQWVTSSVGQLLLFSFHSFFIKLANCLPWCWSLFLLRIHKECDEYFDARVIGLTWFISK